MFFSSGFSPFFCTCAFPSLDSEFRHDDILSPLSPPSSPSEVSHELGTRDVLPPEVVLVFVLGRGDGAGEGTRGEGIGDERRLSARRHSLRAGSSCPRTQYGGDYLDSRVHLAAKPK